MIKASQQSARLQETLLTTLGSMVKLGDVICFIFVYLFICLIVLVIIAAFPMIGRILYK